MGYIRSVKLINIHVTSHLNFIVVTFAFLLLLQLRIAECGDICCLPRICCRRRQFMSVLAACIFAFMHILSPATKCSGFDTFFAKRATIYAINVETQLATEYAVKVETS